MSGSSCTAGPSTSRPWWPPSRFGRCPINVNYRYVGEELAYLFDNAELRVLVLEASFAPVVASIRGQLPLLEHVIVVDDGSDGVGALPDAVAYEDLLAANCHVGRLRAPLGRRRVHRLHRWDHRPAQGSPLASRGHLLRHHDPRSGGEPSRGRGGQRGALRSTPDSLPLAEQGVAVPDIFVSYALGPLMHVSGHWSAWGAMLSGGRTVLHPGRTDGRRHGAPNGRPANVPRC